MQIGDEVVFMLSTGSRFSPVQFNSRNSPRHPCRGKIVKVGRKYVHVQGIEKTPWKLTPYAEGAIAYGGYAVPVDIAKKLYRDGFSGPDEWRSPEFVNECVDSL